ncbi:MAG: hypothetical protein E6R03_01930 [Hyphomicrobiaceae bacterium]|nr:MAG: hypothetical protein E6R03_01930 [Hyphomicrobiaceae bacterium]
MSDGMKPGGKVWIVKGFQVHEFSVCSLDGESAVLDLGRCGLPVSRDEVFVQERDAHFELSKQAASEAEFHRKLMTQYYEMSLASISLGLMSVEPSN